MDEASYDPEILRLYGRKDFSGDFYSPSVVENWRQFIVPRQPRDILEIGSWEGRSAITFLQLLPEATITCVDPFTGLSPAPDPDDQAYLDALGKAEARFDANTAEFGARVTKLKGYSGVVLSELARAGKTFDLIYVDGSHLRDDTLADSILAWRILRKGGLCIWDDRRFGMERPHADRPADALALFEVAFAGTYRILKRKRQLILEKRADWPWRFTIPERGIRRAAPIWLRRLFP